MREKTGVQRLREICLFHKGVIGSADSAHATESKNAIGPAMIPANDPMSELPEGFSKLRRNVGAILKKARKNKRMKQSAVAEDARITPASLSRIENRVGGRLPKLETVAALVDVLGLDWEKVAVPFRREVVRSKDGNSSDAREVTRRADQIQDFGPMIRKARRAAKRSLRDLAEACGMSAAQLSRIERGLGGNSRIFGDASGWENEPWGDRSIEIANEVLAQLVRAAPFD